MKRANRFHKRITYILGSFKIVPLLNFIAAQQISDGVFAADYEFDIILIMTSYWGFRTPFFTSFFDFCVFSKTIHRGTLIFTSNDAEYMICYQCSIDKNGVSSTENKLFTVEKRDFHKLLDMMSQTSKNTDAEVYLFSIAISTENQHLCVVDDWNWVGVLI